MRERRKQTDDALFDFREPMMRTINCSIHARRTVFAGRLCVFVWTIALKMRSR